MSIYNVYIHGENCSLKLLHATIRKCLQNLKPELLIVNSTFPKKELLVKYPEELIISPISVKGGVCSVLPKILDKYINDWFLLVTPGGNISFDIVSRYSKFQKDRIERTIFLPARNRSYDLSGHLLYLPKEIISLLDPELSIQENLFELSNMDVRFKGIQGVLPSSSLKTH